MTDIEQINAAHQAYITAGRDALEHAITAGKLLVKARKAIKKKGDDWPEWLKANCPDISDRTDRLYRRLANNEPKLRKAAGENGNGVAEFSVRGAARLIAKPRQPRPPKLPQPAPAQPSPSRDIHTVLQFTEPDELAVALRQVMEIGVSRFH
jgi:hypothetical protein